MANNSRNGKNNYPGAILPAPYRARPQPIGAVNDEQIRNGNKRALTYATASMDDEHKIIHIRLCMNYGKPSLVTCLLGLAKKPGDAQFEYYARLADEGIAKYWSRTITLKGEAWDVRVRPERSAQGMPLTLANPGSRLLGNLSRRSRNPYPFFTGTLYYDENDGPDPERSYAMTAAHEVGHPLLTHAFGATWSWGHAGTSTLLGRRYDSAPECPAQGEINLMLYYNRNTSCVIGSDSIFERTIASENDLKTLVYIAGRGK
ncbi:hypothetical protein ACO0LL_25815 [Undibacterium sp. TC4M20W]|uniref:hypothetical protein n=1 Tax=Undibacterium sp. TC4M20W TaxID=3413052 RepID=UPI003BEF89EF